MTEKGLAQAAKRADRVASEGVVELYSHGNGRVGVMVEVNCETDFVAGSDAFREFAHEIALQIAASSPLYVTEDNIPEDVLEEVRKEAHEWAINEGKPENIIDRIVDGRVTKFKEEKVLMNQPYIRDDEMTIEKLYHQKVAAIGEKIIIRRFERWALGEQSAVEEE